MRNVHFQRASLLFEHGRFTDAIGELRLQLADGAEDALAHGLLGLCLAEVEKYDDATHHAGQAIHLAPEQPFGQYAMAQVMMRRNRFAEAQAAIMEAIRLNPYSADYFAILASLHLRAQRWREALAAADQGLAIEPEHPLCTNLRARALVNLGDRAAAAATMHQALARRPDDPQAHANQGWTLLHQGQPNKAMEHFREALRLDPEMEFARAGIVEAMKARHIVYRWMLAYFLWMTRLDSRVRWGLVIGALFGNQLISQQVARTPALAPILLPILFAYFGFVLMSWLAYPLFNLLLRLDRFGRLALSRDQVKGANVLVVCFAVTIACLALAIATGHLRLYEATVMFAVLALPASAIYVCDAGWPRQAMTAITLALGAVIAYVVTIVALVTLYPSIVFALAVVLAVQASRVLPYALLASQFAAMWLARVTPKK
jgi:tetratricopeptide (TPR) repeat protein